MSNKSTSTEEYWGINQKILVTLDKNNIEKLDKIARKYSLNRSAVLNIFTSQLTGDEEIIMDTNVKKTDLKSNN